MPYDNSSRGPQGRACLTDHSGVIWAPPTGARRTSPGAIVGARRTSREESVEREVALHLPVTDVRAELLPFDALRLHESFDHGAAECVEEHVVLEQRVERLD